MNDNDVTLPPGAEVLAERSPVEPDPEGDLDLAIQLARLGASDELIRIVGGEVAVEEVHRVRDEQSHPPGMAAAAGPN